MPFSGSLLGTDPLIAHPLGHSPSRQDLEPTAQMMRLWLFCAVMVFPKACLISVHGSNLLHNVSRDEGERITPGPERWREPSGLSLRKQKRETHCLNSTDGCCNECPKGSFLKCTCEPCGDGTFLEHPNRLRQCLPCTVCRSQDLQVEVKKCTAASDRECGCERGYYKRYDLALEAKYFSCEPCADCAILNRRTQRNCSEAEDATCGACLPNFHPQGEGYLKMWSDNGEDTEMQKQQCILHKSGFRPVYLLLCLPCLLLVGAFGIYCKRRHITRNSSPVDMLLSAAGGKCKSEEPSEFPPSASPSHGQPGLFGADPPPHRSLLQGRKLYTVIDAVPARRWKEFVRGLGLRDGEIEAVEVEHAQLREQQYEMLKRWRQRQGATIDAIFPVLEDMQLGGCAQELREQLQLGDPVSEVGC